MNVVINYDSSTEEYRLYSSDLDLEIKSTELFKLLVLFNSYIVDKFGDGFNVLKSDDIVYVLDSRSLRRIIQSNVDLIKKLNVSPSRFSRSSEKFGISSTNKFSNSFNKNKGVEEYNSMMSKRKSFKYSKFKKS